MDDFFDEDDDDVDGCDDGGGTGGPGVPSDESIRYAHNRSAFDRVSRPQFGAPTGNKPLLLSISS